MKHVCVQPKQTNKQCTKLAQLNALTFIFILDLMEMKNKNAIGGGNYIVNAVPDSAIYFTLDSLVMSDDD